MNFSTLTIDDSQLLTPQIAPVSGISKLLTSILDDIVSYEDDRDGFDKRWLQNELDVNPHTNLGLLITRLMSHQLPPQYKIVDPTEYPTVEVDIADVSKACLGNPFTKGVIADDQMYQNSRFKGQIFHQQIYSINIIRPTKTQRIHLIMGGHMLRLNNLPILSDFRDLGNRPIFYSIEQSDVFLNTCSEVDAKWAPVGRIRMTEDIAIFTPAVLDTPSLTTINKDSCLKRCTSFAYLDWKKLDILIPLYNNDYGLVQTNYISRGTLAALLILLKNHLFTSRGLGWILSIYPEVFWNVYIRSVGFFTKKKIDVEQQWMKACALICSDITLRSDLEFLGIINNEITNFIKKVHSAFPVDEKSDSWTRNRRFDDVVGLSLADKHFNNIRSQFIRTMPIKDNDRMTLWFINCQDQYWPYKILGICYDSRVGRTVITRVPVPEGGCLTEYNGELVLNERSIIIRESAYESLCDFKEESYLFYFNKNRIIYRNKEDTGSLSQNRPTLSSDDSAKYMLDASAETIGIGRLVNHSKKAFNCIAKVFSDCSCNLPRLCFIAKRDLVAGEEIRIDYGDTSKWARAYNPWLKN